MKLILSIFILYIHRWLFDKIDLNNNGKISYSEFESFLQNNKLYSYLSSSDVVEMILEKILVKLRKDPNILKKMFNEADINHNKKLSRNEF